ncbi:MAG: hypothetical protein EA392_01315 [Cryomorphaceae bacterium]|nr:MAG: hypothetical protein EA392_01315 [Cryomorphaceae bacterium]
MLFCPAVSPAQNKPFGQWGLFSLDRPFPEPEAKRFVPLVQLDGSTMFVGKRSVRLGGLKAGVMDRELGISAGIGFYAFTNRLRRDPGFVDEIGKTTNIESDFGLITLFLQPRVFENRRFLVTAPISYGFGGVDQFYQTEVGSLRFLRSFRVSVLSLNGAAEFRVFYWLAFGGGLGYQFFGAADSQLQREYSGFSYHLRLKIDIIDLYKTVQFQTRKE